MIFCNNFFDYKSTSETLSVNDWGTTLVVLCSCDPHGLECGKGWKDRTSDPDWEFSLRWGNNFNFHWCWGECCDFFAESFWDSWEHGCTSRHDDVSITMINENSYRSFLTSISHFMMDLKVSSWIPGTSIPMKLGLNKSSGHLNL